jgi:hypothetical protein
VIPPPPLDGQGAVALAGGEVAAQLVGGLLCACCMCGHGSQWHLLSGNRFYALHKRDCPDRLVSRWREMVAAGQLASPSTTLTGAYARRAVARGVSVPVSVASISQGSPFFRPGMAEGEPWVAIGVDGDGREFVAPGGADGEHVRGVSRRWQLLADKRWPTHPGGPLLVSGWVVTPTGEVIEKWSVL